MVKISFDEPAPKAAASAPFALSAAAAKRIEALLTKPDEPATMLRVAVLGGGCNGYSYSFKLETAKKETDIELSHPEFKAAKVIIDPQSHSLLAGATLDFVDTIEASQFVINNPNASSSCGCGNSFGL